MDEPRDSPFAGLSGQGQGCLDIDLLQVPSPGLWMITQSRQMEDRGASRQQRRVGGRLPEIAGRDPQIGMAQVRQGVGVPAEGHHGAALGEQGRDQRTAEKARGARDQRFAAQRSTSIFSS